MMTRIIQSLRHIAKSYELIVFDQWGVLHNGSEVFGSALFIMRQIRAMGIRTAMLSNSGKRAQYNIDRMANLGFDISLFDIAMTSGEAFWNDVFAKKVPERVFYPIEQNEGDAQSWAGNIDVNLTSEINKADAILLMGLPKNPHLDNWEVFIGWALNRGLKIYCTNPDVVSPRATGLVQSPGALAHLYAEMGGQVEFYGKPYSNVFQALASKFCAKKILMVGDSLEHDVAGSNRVGWDSLFIQSGIAKAHFVDGNAKEILDKLISEYGGPAPNYQMWCLT